MSEEKSNKTRLEIPEELRPDALTFYIYRHFSNLLTDEELAVERVRVSLCKQLAYKWEEPKLANFFRVPEVYQRFPSLQQQVRTIGCAKLMRIAADRVLRDNPHVKILHNCPKCGELCLTPRARHCLSCGHAWDLDLPGA